MAGGPTSGRTRKPTVIRKLEGMRGHHPLPKDEPVGNGRPRVPKHLAPEAAECYRDIVKSLPVELLTRADESTLERAAVAWAQYRDATRKLDQSGLLVKGLHNQPIRNPLLMVQRAASADLAQSGAMLGLSPAARARISAPELVDEDPMALLLGDGTNAWATNGTEEKRH
jgi:P27 family predicted phage terminase small subunit